MLRSISLLSTILFICLQFCMAQKKFEVYRKSNVLVKGIGLEGKGVVVGSWKSIDSCVVYIATAKHLLPEDDQKTSEKVEIAVYGTESIWWPVSNIKRHENNEIDLAVLTAKLQNPATCEFPKILYSKYNFIKEHSKVFIFGPGFNENSVNVTQDIPLNQGTSFTISANSVGPGLSGGGIFLQKNKKFIGIFLSSNKSESKCVSVFAIKSFLEKIGIPHNSLLLREKKINLHPYTKIFGTIGLGIVAIGTTSKLISNNYYNNYRNDALILSEFEFQNRYGYLPREAFSKARSFNLGSIISFGVGIPLVFTSSTFSFRKR